MSRTLFVIQGGEMDKNEIKDKLEDLIKLDIDAVNAYEQAIGSIDDSQIKGRIMEFKDDHVRHIDSLSGEYRKHTGEAAPSRKPDLKGYMLKGFTALSGVTGTDGALEAMQANEKLTNKTYREAMDWDMPQEVQLIIERNYNDEQRHLVYINSTLESRAAVK
jgi:rubrerythrin